MFSAAPPENVNQSPTRSARHSLITPRRYESEDGRGGASCRNQKSLISIRCSMSREMHYPKDTTSAPWGPATAPTAGADMVGVGGLDSTTDRNGTGERASLENDADADAQSDIAADGIVEAEEAGLGGGLDQAEEAQLGVTDEEIEDAVRDTSRAREAVADDGSPRGSARVDPHADRDTTPRDEESRHEADGREEELRVVARVRIRRTTRSARRAANRSSGN